MSDFFDTAWQLGFKEGFEEGFEEGKEEAIEQQSQKIAEKLYAQHRSVEYIANALDRDIEQIEEWLELVKA